MEEELLYQTSDMLSSPATTISTEAAAVTAAFFGVFGFAMLVLTIISLIALWKIFAKAGVEGWKSIIPIYNLYVLLQIVGRPGWWLLLLYFVPIVNIVVAIILCLDLAKSFGKSTTFAIFGLVLFSLVGHLILAFGSAKYIGPGALMGSSDGTSDGTPLPAPEAETTPVTA